MTDLPPIPDEAVDAAWFVTELDRHDMPVVAHALIAAWPHLYAAALRHAADTLPDDQADWWYRDHLRHLADDAAP